MGAKRAKKMATNSSDAARSKAMTLHDSTASTPATFHTQVWLPGIRKWVLQCLYRFVAARVANEEVLSGFLSRLGYRIPSADLRSQLQWLLAEGLVRDVRPPDVGLLVVELTEAGFDVADGRVVHPDVTRV